jgi:folate-binding protein YgfZ
MPQTPSPEHQVEAARRAVLVVESPEFSALVVTGKDRVSWLNGLVTCDLAAWGATAMDEARYGLVVSRAGRVLADPLLVHDGDRVIAVVVASLAERLREHLDHYLVMEDAEVARASGALECWMVHGPASQDVLAAARAAGAAGGSFDRTGLGGAVIVAMGEGVSTVRAAVEAAVRDASGVVGDAAGWEALRLERGVATIGVDFDDKTYPQEASLEKAAVSFNKGCYLGQEVVCMLEMRGHVKRKLVSIVLDAGEGPPGPGASITEEGGATVGEVTSLAHSPTLGVSVGLAMLKRAQAVAGARVAVGGAVVNATVVERPA